MSEAILKAAMGLCERRAKMEELRLQARAVPACEKAGSQAWHPADKYCSDILEGGDGEPSPLPWWFASHEQLERMCAPCQSRVALWAERVRVRAGLGGSMAALMKVYRRNAGIQRPKDRNAPSSPKYRAYQDQRDDWRDAQDEGPF